VYGKTGRAPNVDVAIDLDVEPFWDLVVASLARYGPDDDA
jgi:inosine-uridine nucleoside N-ribohydrolase